MKQKFDSEPAPHDDMAMTRGPIMQVNFAPVWQGRQHDMTWHVWDRCANLDLTKTDQKEKLEEYAVFVATYGLEGSIWHGFLLMMLAKQETDGILPELLKKMEEELKKGDAIEYGEADKNDRAGQVPENVDDSSESDGSSGMQLDAAMSLQVAPDVPRFKKARTDTAAAAQQAPEMAQQAPEMAGADTAVQQPPAATAAADGAGARADGGWDFEADLAAIFTGETSADKGAGAKARPKPKTKGT
jgi:hypothetical protein